MNHIEQRGVADLHYGRVSAGVAESDRPHGRGASVAPFLGTLEVAVSMASDRQPRRFSFRKPVVQIGASKSCDIRIDDDRLRGRRLVLCALPDILVPIECTRHQRETRHAFKFAEQSEAAFKGTLSRLFLGDICFTAELVLTDGRKAPVGQLLLHSENQISTQLGFRFLNASSKRSQTSQRYLRDCVTLIGKRYPSHIKLANAPIADVQCSVYRDGHRLFIENLYPDDRLTVNGRAVHKVELTEGDLIVLGQYEMELFVEHVSSSPGMDHDLLEGTSAGELLSVAYQSLGVTQTAWPPAGGLSLEALLRSSTAAQPADSSASLKDALQPLVDVLERLAEAQCRTAEQASKHCDLLTQLISELGSNQRESAKSLLRRTEILETEILTLRREREALRPVLVGPYARPLVGPPLLPAETASAGSEHDPAVTTAHKELNDRLFKLEKERSSCFQKLLGLFTGVRS